MADKNWINDWIVILYQLSWSRIYYVVWRDNIQECRSYLIYASDRGDELTQQSRCNAGNMDKGALQTTSLHSH